MYQKNDGSSLPEYYTPFPLVFHFISLVHNYKSSSHLPNAICIDKIRLKKYVEEKIYDVLMKIKTPFTLMK